MSRHRDLGDTREMRRLPDSPLLSDHQRFLLLCLLGAITALGALWLVVLSNPIAPNIPGAHASAFSPLPPSTELVVLPEGSTASLRAVRTAPATHARASTPRPSQTPSAPPVTAVRSAHPSSSATGSES